MLRYREITIGKNKYLCVLSNRVIARMEEEGIDRGSLATSKTQVRDILRIICMMIESGSRYAAMMSMGEYGTISLEDLQDLTGTEDYSGFIDLFTELAQGRRNVDAEPQGNAPADREAPGN